MRSSSWSPRMVMSWIDRDPRVAVVFAVPLTILLLAAVAAHPLVFVPLLVLGAVALILTDLYEGQKRSAVGGPAARLGLEPDPRARAEAAEAEARAAEARATQARARAEAAEARAAEARARAIQLRA
jgi:colicin import membrane protein